MPTSFCRISARLEPTPGRYVIDLLSKSSICLWIVSPCSLRVDKYSNFRQKRQGSGQSVRRKRRKATAVGVKNHGDLRKFRCPSFWKTTGNEIYNDGHQKLRQRATKFWATGSLIFGSNRQRDFIGNNRYRKFLRNGHRNSYTNLTLYLENASISNLFFIRAYLYIRIGINNKFHIW